MPHCPGSEHEEQFKSMVGGGKGKRGKRGKRGKGKRGEKKQLIRKWNRMANNTEKKMKKPVDNMELEFVKIDNDVHSGPENFDSPTGLPHSSFQMGNHDQATSTIYSVLSDDGRGYNGDEEAEVIQVAENFEKKTW